MKLGRTSRILLVLAFLMGQMFALSHSIHHELLAHGKTPCEICAVAHASAVPPAPLLPVAQVIPHGMVEAMPALAPSDRRPFARPNTRGPPAILV